MMGSISETTSRIRTGEISPYDVFEYLMERIRKFDGTIKSYTTLNETAAHDAERLSELAHRGDFLGLLHGIPVSAKDLIDTAGIRTTYGNRKFSGNIPEKNAGVIDSIISSGGYIIGKTNTHEFALGSESPPTANPYDTSRIPGGSSGGSAAALAADLAIFAIGSDTGGSIRIPAAMCGVTGFKPTYGLISTRGVFPESWSLDHLGPMVRHAEDIPLAMEAMGSSLPPLKLNRPLKAGMIRDFFDASNNEVARTVETSLQKLESSGTVELVDFHSDVFPESVKFHEIIDTSEIAAVHGDMYREDSSVYMKSSVQQIEAGLARPAPDYIIALREREGLYRKLMRDLGDIDILVSPTLPEVAPTAAEYSRLDLAGHDWYIQFQAEFNYLGMPALTVPCGLVRSLPVGLQIVSRKYEDSKAINAAVDYQKLTDWHLRVPDLH